MGFIAEFRKKGVRIPGNLSVITFDDYGQYMGLAEFATWIDIQESLLTETAFNTLFGLITGDKNILVVTRVPTRLFVRKSTEVPVS